ncbi:MAG: glutamyl-tRNA synthetase [Solirubrobacteraceae bacterium]|nr:glutamyl-tRNA synthetase [Solirubrobacteraceae bacterium]
MRFSPSPTGPFHVGGARTALFNWLFARGRQGEFLVRNEDTDPVRSSEHWLEGIFDGLRWLGLDWDGEIVNQSDRKPAHLAAAQQLVDSGHAYWCDCTAEDIERRKGPGGGYDNFCRDRGLGPGEDRVVRFRVPEGSTTVDDVVRGGTTFDNSLIDDFVIVRRGGAPIFVLANTVDDEYQQITHVIRGEEHLPTTPRYLMLRRALGYGEDPVFAHLPVLVNEKRQKLSKRRDKVALLEFRDQGYTAEAMRSYLALLGWSPRDGDEFAPLERLVEEFRLEDVTRAPAFFDVQKLQHINAHYLREMTPEAFAEAARPWVEGDAAPWPEQSFDWDRFVALAPLVQTRVKLLSEVPELVAFVFQDAVEIDEAAWEKAIERNAWSADVLRDAVADYAGVPWEAEALKDATAAIAERHGVALRKAQAPVRVAVTGTTVGLPLFESLELLGREPVRARLEHALERVGAAPAR